MTAVLARFETAGDEQRTPMLLEVLAGDGVWTPGPFARLDAGNEVELTEAELAWIVEDIGPAALERLRKHAARTEPGPQDPPDRKE